METYKQKPAILKIWLILSASKLFVFFLSLSLFVRVIYLNTLILLSLTYLVIRRYMKSWHRKSRKKELVVSNQQEAFMGIGIWKIKIK